MSGGPEYDTEGEECYQVETHLQAPANILIIRFTIRGLGIIFWLISEMIFLHREQILEMFDHAYGSYMVSF